MLVQLRELRKTRDRKLKQIQEKKAQTERAARFHFEHLTTVQEAVGTLADVISSDSDSVGSGDDMVPKPPEPDETLTLAQARTLQLEYMARLRRHKAKGKKFKEARAVKEAKTKIAWRMLQAMRDGDGRFFMRLLMFQVQPGDRM
jgi:hypothetical protein